jgi:hypothetical protein
MEMYCITHGKFVLEISRSNSLGEDIAQGALNLYKQIGNMIGPIQEACFILKSFL